ncbi:Sir2 family NAD-dependent protein deacetylase [uncultured Thiodictyon sp.]|uniref:SIR2 family NAD-dependent protein deacylase n=1 Tax=uncultured Thiodictyon sp. TaxID=1846217 RepID=UPI0025F48FA7|nr:Sir2 family NAD-dependent protein deacetylase [uncultured Thiodictyon sp.]
MNMPFENDLARASDLIDQADALIVAAGAGMGVDSGLPDFRGNEGFWAAYPALGRARLNFYEAASPTTFERDPRLAWGFYGHRLMLYRQTVPHAGFDILKRWGQGMRHGVFAFTSNVDGHFQKAGFDDNSIVEVHGSIHHLQCLARCRDAIWTAQDFQPVVDSQACRLLNALPTCPHCGRLARPNILMFDDVDWVEARQLQQMERLQQWLEPVRHPVVLELGAGTAIATVRHFSQDVIHDWGGRLIRINPTEYRVSDGLDVGLACGALEGMSVIDQYLKGLLDFAHL